MVDHYAESACEVLSQKASPVAMTWSNTDHVQGIHADLTLNIAPSTPIQASIAWQKPLAQESPNSLPSLSLGKSSSEISKRDKNQPRPARCGQAGVSTMLSKLQNRIQSEVEKDGPQVHKENLLSFALSKYETRSQAGHQPDFTMPLSNHAGHPFLHRDQVSAGSSKVSFTDMFASPPQHVIYPKKEGFHSGFKVLPDKSPLRAHKHVDKKHSMTAALSERCESYTCNSKLNLEFESSTSLYSPAPGEVANNAYKLYSEMFPSACADTVLCSPSSAHSEGGLCLPKPFLEHMDIVQLLPSPLYEQQAVAKGKCDYINDNGKKLKYTLKEEGALLKVKEEPGLDSFTEPQWTHTCVIQNFSNHGDTGRMSALNSTQEHVQPGGETPPKECGGEQCPVDQPRHSRATPPSHLMAVSLPKPSKVIDVFHSSEDIRDASLAVEMTNVQPAAGLKLFAASAYPQLPESLLNSSSGEALIPLSSEPSSKMMPRSGSGRTPAHHSSSTDADWGKFLALSATPLGNSAETATASMFPFQERFKELQTFLKQCDEADPNECIQDLRSLSAAARSGYAVELEKRAVKLSLEEGKEMKRMRLLNVLGRNSERSVDDAGATPQGPRLPAPGAPSKIKQEP